MPYALGRQGAGGDLFAVNPIRRSAGAIVVCAALIALPLLVLHGDTQQAVGLPTSWIGLTGLILCIPILSISLLEEGWQRPQRRIWPTIDQLELPPRAHNLLRRHGFVTIASVEEAPDVALILLSNMDARVLREIRRAIGAIGAGRSAAFAARGREHVHRLSVMLFGCHDGRARIDRFAGVGC